MNVILSERLPLLTNAPDGIRKVRSLILDLAMRGKLVQQNAEDEPASEILKRISLERARLEAEGTYRKTKPLPVLGDEERPHELPPSWVWTRLGEVTNFGQTDKNGEVTERTWVLDLEDIQKDTSVLIKKVRFAERHAKSDKNRFQSGDVLYGKLRPYLNKVIVADEDGICTTEVLPVRGFCGIVPRFLMHALKRSDFLAYVNSKSYGMKMPRLGTEDGRLAVFPLPPEAEQHRIVAKVDELMALCDRLEKEQSGAESAHARLVDSLLGTLSRSMDSADLDSSWQRLARNFDSIISTPYAVSSLRKVVLSLAAQGRLVPHAEPAEYYPLSAVIEGGSLNGCSKKPGNNSSGIQILRISAGTGNDNFLVDETDHRWIDATPAEIEKFQLLPDDLLACRFNGNLHYVGSFSLYQGKSGVSQVFPDKLIRFRARRDKVLPHYLRYVLNADSARDQIERFCATTVGNIGISATNLKTVKIRVPSLDEQRSIIARVDQLLALCDVLRADLARSRNCEAQLTSTLIESACKAA